MKPILPLVLLLGISASAVPAHAQVETREGIFLQNQIQELKRDIARLRDQVSSSGGGSSLGSSRSSSSGGNLSGDIATQLLDRVSRLEDEVRQLHGQMDETRNAQKRMGDDLGKQIDDLNFKLGNGAGGLPPSAPPARSPGPASLGGGAPAAPPPAAVPRRTAENALQEGNAALARRDYATAEAAAREVLAMPKSPRSTDAQFLLAQSLAGKRDFQNAAIAYDDTYNRARTGGHAQDSLLGLANSLTAIGEKRAACATIDKLRAEFPNPRSDLREPVAAAASRAGCR